MDFLRWPFARLCSSLSLLTLLVACTVGEEQSLSEAEQLTPDPVLTPRQSVLIDSGMEPLSYAESQDYYLQLVAALQPLADGKDIAFHQEEHEQTVELSLSADWALSKDSQSLLPRAESALTPLAMRLVEFDRTLLDVVGHSDASGPAGFNLQVSQKRAQAVALWLEQQGVKRSRFFVFGVGEHRPVAANDTPAGRAANRRIALRIRPFSTKAPEEDESAVSQNLPL